MITLGGNITLNGFSALDKGELSVVKKMVGNYVKRFNDLASNFENSDQGTASRTVSLLRTHWFMLSAN